MPNAGLPQRLEGRFVYAAEPPWFGVDRAAAPRRRRADRRRLLRHDARPTSPRCAPRSTADSRARRPARIGRPRRGVVRRHRGDPAHRARPRRPPAMRARARHPPRRTRSPTGRFVISRRDRPAAQRPHRAHDRGRPPAAGRRRRPRQHQRLGHGARAHGRDGRRVRHPARPRPRVPRPLHDPRPQPDGARVGAAGRARARRPQHPRADRRPAADRRLPHRHAASGTSTRSA